MIISKIEYHQKATLCMQFFKRNILISYIVPILFFIFSFFYLLMGFRFYLNQGIYDEGLAIYPSLLFQKGLSPVTDFMPSLGGITILWPAWAFKIFGISIITERILTVVILTLIALSVFLIIKQTINNVTFAFIGWITVLAWFRQKIWYSNLVYPAVLFSLLTILSFFYFFKFKKLIWLFLAGILCGLTIIFRIDFGFALLAVTSFCSALIIFKKTYIKTSFKQIMFAYFFSIMLIYAPFYIYILPTTKAVNVFSYFLLNLKFYPLFFPAYIFPFMLNSFYIRHKPFPPLCLDRFENFIYYVVLIIILISITNALRAYFLKSESSEKSFFKLYISLLGCAYFLYTYLRPDIIHLWPTVTVGIILLVFDLSTLSSFRKLPTTIVMIISVYLLIISGVEHFFLEKNINLGSAHKFVDLEYARGCIDWTNSTMYQLKAIKFIQKRTKRNDRIFVGNSRHDIICNNDNMFYFLSDRISATKFFSLSAGFATQNFSQSLIIQDIIKNNVTYIVLLWRPKDQAEPNLSGKSSDTKTLDNFIRKTYRTIKFIGPYEILSKIDAG